MPSTNKKTPATNIRRKVTASARARTSITKPKKASNDLNESYIQHVSTVSDTVNHTVMVNPTQPTSSSSNDAIL